MTRKWMKFLLPALFVTLTAWGCDSVSEARLTGPSQGPDEILIERVINGVKVVVETDAEVGSVKGTFGPEGGLLALGEHALVIPEGAVKSPTVFRMTKPTPKLEFTLTATSVGSLLPNNVGARGFEKPVKLAISYEGTNISNPSGLRVVWMKLIGSETQPTSFDTYKKWVVGDLTHFSQYALAWP